MFWRSRLQLAKDILGDKLFEKCTFGAFLRIFTFWWNGSLKYSKNVHVFATEKDTVTALFYRSMGLEDMLPIATHATLCVLVYTSIKIHP